MSHYTTDDASEGWRIAPKPGALLRRTEAGRFAVPLIVTFDGEQRSEIEYIYTGSEIEHLYRQMCALVAEGAPEPPARDYSAHEARREDRRAQKFEMGVIN